MSFAEQPADIIKLEYSEDNVECKCSIQKQQFRCDLCATSYSSKYSLKYHLNVHTGIGLYKCEVCSSTFTDTSALKKTF